MIRKANIPATEAKRNVSDYVPERLCEWACRAGDAFELVQLAHEEIASLAASAHAKFSGDLGVCVATSGPGAIHRLNGLRDAKLDGQPVLAVVGQQALELTREQQDDLATALRSGDPDAEWVELQLVEQGIHGEG